MVKGHMTLQPQACLMKQEGYAWASIADDMSAEASFNEIPTGISIFSLFSFCGSICLGQDCQTKIGLLLMLHQNGLRQDSCLVLDSTSESRYLQEVIAVLHILPVVIING